jgi:hypothetical protein
MALQASSRTLGRRGAPLRCQVLQMEPSWLARAQPPHHRRRACNQARQLTLRLPPAPAPRRSLSRHVRCLRPCTALLNGVLCVIVACSETAFWAAQALALQPLWGFVCHCCMLQRVELFLG